MGLNIVPSLHEHDEAIWVAVLWQDGDIHQQQLYIYIVPAENPAYRRIGVGLTTMRVTSLAFNMGGVHPESPLLSPKYASSTRVSQLETLGGGLSLVIKESRRSDNARREVLVWGPPNDNSSQKSIRFSVYDLMFSEQEMTTARYFPRNTELHVDLNATCACALHDYDYRVAVPRGVSVARAGPPQYSFVQRFFGGSNVSEKPGVVTSYPGSVTVYHPPARKAALTRAQDGMKELIRYFMYHGMQDEELLNAWNNAAWSNWGRIPLPEGWRDLGEMGEEVRIARKICRMLGRS